MGRGTAATLVIAGTLVSACSGVGRGELEDGFGADLSSVGGCSDIYLHARNDSDTKALEARFPELIDEARAAGGEKTFSFALPDPEVTWDNPATVSATFVDVVLDHEGERVELGPFELADVGVGWLPG
jgi:hypothetical protein